MVTVTVRLSPLGRNQLTATSQGLTWHSVLHREHRSPHCHPTNRKTQPQALSKKKSRMRIILNRCTSCRYCNPDVFFDSFLPFLQQWNGARFCHRLKLLYLLPLLYPRMRESYSWTKLSVVSQVTMLTMNHGCMLNKCNVIKIFLCTLLSSYLSLFTWSGFTCTSWTDTQFWKVVPGDEDLWGRRYEQRLCYQSATFLTSHTRNATLRIQRLGNLFFTQPSLF